MTNISMPSRNTPTEFCDRCGSARLVFKKYFINSNRENCACGFLMYSMALYFYLVIMDRLFYLLVVLLAFVQRPRFNAVLPVYPHRLLVCFCVYIRMCNHISTFQCFDNRPRKLQLFLRPMIVPWFDRTLFCYFAVHIFTLPIEICLLKLHIHCNTGRQNIEDLHHYSTTHIILRSKISI